MYHFAVFAGIRVVDFRGLDVVRRIDPIESVGVPCFFVWIVLDLVVRGPLHGDIPIAVAKHSSNQAALGGLCVRLPFRWAHQFVFTAGVSGGADDLRDIFASTVVELFKLGIDGGEKLAGAVTHNKNVVCAGGTLACAVVELLGAGNQIVLHLASVILTD